MGRSTTSCFKIISCGCINDSVERDEINVSSKNKGVDKPRWSFQKNSPTQQVQSNTVVTETTPSSENKQIPEPIAISSEPQVTSNISEKTSDNIWTEETPNSITKNATVSTVATKPACEEDDIKCEPARDESESAIIVIQATVRRFLAERRLVKHKKSRTPDCDEDEVVNNTESEVKTVISSNNVGEETARLEEKDKLVNYEESSNVKTHGEEPIVEAMVIPVSETKPKPIPEIPVSDTEPSHTDQPDSAGKKYEFGSRKATNPAFVAAQSRFEELTSSKTNPLNSAHSSNQDYEACSGSVSGLPADTDSSDPLKPDNEVVSRADIGSSAPGKVTLVTDVEPYGSRVVQNGGSECGTELSITSTLDSPDQSETENKKLEEAEVVNQAAGDMNMNIDNNNNNNNSIDIVMPEKQVDQKLDDSEIDPPKSTHHVYESNEHEPVVQLSVSGSPRSHMTTLESQGTPSSQVSTNAKKSKTDRKASGQKQKSWSTSTKSSPIRSSVTSGLRSSLEQLPKDAKPVKRRTSSGSPKPDHSDHEPSVPSYMQATESARAKAVSSPRSSPDVHDKESYLKKRHSLPGAVNGRQGSPRVQRSMSQALQTTKGNSNQERKWQR